MTDNKYGRVRSFRIHNLEERLLNQSFELLEIEETTFNNKMIHYIRATHKSLKELLELRPKMQILEAELERLEDENKLIQPEIQKTPKIKANTKAGIKTEPTRPALAMQKGDISMKTLEKDDWLVCPDKDDWVKKSVDCKKCGEENFRKFKECWLERRKNPFGDLFKCSKPKPNL